MPFDFSIPLFLDLATPKLLLFKKILTTTFDLLHGGDGWKLGDFFYIWMKDAYYKVTVEAISTAATQANLALVRPNPTPFDVQTTITAESILGDIRTEILAATDSNGFSTTLTDSQGTWNPNNLAQTYDMVIDANDNLPPTLDIILPQAVRVTMPAIVSNMIGLWKDTSLIHLLGIHDAFQVAKVLPAQWEFTGLYPEALLFVGMIFWIVSFYLSKISQRIEKNLGLRNESGGEMT